jgi:hypothetical protein
VKPITGVVFDSILIIIDRLTKYGYFILYKESLSAEELAYTFNKHIIGNYGISKKIISDRDKLFISRFWKSLADQLRIHYKMFTGYYPQTNGQTERLNQTLKQYLRFYINYKQINWVSLLSTAQLVYNSAATATTGISPFYANYGYNLQTTVHPRGITTEA